MIPNERPTPLTDAVSQWPLGEPESQRLIAQRYLDFARTLERSLAAVTAELEMWRDGSIVREEDKAERDALKHALIELEAAAEAYAADQSRATDSRCGLVQPITVEDGNRLLSALKIANELTK
jgi:hypothetical protein